MEPGLAEQVTAKSGVGAGWVTTTEQLVVAVLQLDLTVNDAV